MIVGGIAVGFHGQPRYTKDLDVLVAIGPSEETKLYECLKEYGAPVHILEPAEFLQDDFIFHFGIPPWRVDVLTSIPGVDFEKAYRDRVALPLGEYSACCISRDWLIKAKRASGRPQDLLDLNALESGADLDPG
ncbi:MAG: hypothetical protein ACAH95_15255 [Fimbriimonas sp.]